MSHHEVIAKNNGGTVVTIDYQVSNLLREEGCYDKTCLQAEVDKAMQQAEWSWYDVMIGFREMGVDSSQQAKDRIMKQIFTKKLKNIIIKNNKIPTNDKRI